MNQKLSKSGSYNSRKKINERILKLLITSNCSLNKLETPLSRTGVHVVFADSP